MTILCGLAWLLLGFDPEGEAKRLQASAAATTSASPGGSRIVRVALLEGVPRVELSFRGGRQAAGRRWSSLTARAESGQVRLVAPGVDTLVPSIEWAGDSLACIERRCYRGSIRLQPWAGGLLALNEVELEDYLLGVVPGEIGRKLRWKLYEAVRAQAVVARTYTIRSLGQYQGKPWDLRDDVRDQVYEGALGEDPLCSRAVRSTRRQILVDAAGAPVDAYYHSTSGGRTADIVDVWPHKEARPYLRGVVDTAPDGRAWSGGSNSSEWTESWDGQSLRAAVRTDLSEAVGRKVDPGEVKSLRLEGRDSSGRASKLVVEGTLAVVEVPSDRIRWALRRPAKGRPILRSSRFELREQNGRYHAVGTGNGHGVGMSQNGAMGRAWAGHTYAQILSAYYPGTQLRNLEP